MHNYSELHFTVFTLKTVNVYVSFYIYIYMYVINQQLWKNHPGTSVQQHCRNAIELLSICAFSSCYIPTSLLDSVMPGKNSGCPTTLKCSNEIT